MTPPAPDFAYVVPTDRYETIARVVRMVRAQTARERIELIVPTPDPDGVETALGGPGDLAAERAVAATLDVDDPGGRLADARAAGIRASTAPIVFIGETHSFPGPDMVEAMLRAHDEGWDVVVPAFENANDEGIAAWAGFVGDYGEWAASAEPGAIDYAPFYNVSYRREALLSLGDRLAPALHHGDEMVLHLRKEGYRIGFDPRARIAHLNVAPPADAMRERFAAGALIGGTRARRWGWPRRVAYVAATPLIAAVLARRGLSGLAKVRRSTSVPRGTALAMLASAAIQAVGEGVGYAVGAPDSVSRVMEELELHRERYGDRKRTPDAEPPSG